MRRRVELALILAVLASCAGDPGETPPDRCKLASCDVPHDPAARSCELRRSDAFNKNQLGFTEQALRWSCADVNGVTGVDRGQEYCEYFAVVRLPAPMDSTPQVIGQISRIEDPFQAEATAYELPRPALELDQAELDALEQDEAAIVGQCVFTSWNEDITDEIPACAEGDCPDVLGLPITADDFRMKFDVNSAAAGRALVEECTCAFDPTYESCSAPDRLEGDPNNASDVLHDDFMRGCLLNAHINETEFRKSDSTLCSAVLRMAECGCLSESGDLLDLATMLSPPDRRGFPLGTWSSPSELPPGCRFAELGDDSQTVVTCDLSAAEVINHSADLKQLCREKYGPNVVVHVPISQTGIECTPESSDSAYADTCSATPWVLTGK